MYYMVCKYLVFFVSERYLHKLVKIYIWARPARQNLVLVDEIGFLLVFEYSIKESSLNTFVPSLAFLKIFYTI